MAQQGRGGGRGNFGRGFGRGGAHGGFGGPGGYRGGELKMPPGWEECPPFGNPIEINKDKGEYLKMIPSKVPLSRAYDRLLKNPSLNHYTINDAINSVEQQFQGRVSLIIDLTKSNRYYDFNKEVPSRTLAGTGGYFTAETIIHCKIPCQGHNQSPDTFAVNQAAFEVQRMLSYRPDDYIIVHCTHGFNRTGYVIINTMVRLASTVGFSIARCLKRFAMARPPGIYKDAYIDDLFKYHHENRAAAQILTPPVPSWKGLGDEDDEGEPEAPPEPPKEVTHERIEEIGEAIPVEEAWMLQNKVYQWLTGTDLPEGRQPHFPGSQPVSLDRQNLSLLHMTRYWVSWKADGTRYLLLILNQGCYLINREFKVVRLQMRFPMPQKPSAAKIYPVSAPHHETLLDGEMVVDVDPSSGVKMRRYLAYDLVVLKGHPLRDMPWLQRYLALRKEVISPRDKEKRYIQKLLPEKFVSPPLPYKYETEACSVRLKDFWPLFRARKVIDKMIPSLCHEADGLILQSCNSGYVANTDNALLKFKFAHLNSVDFHLEVDATAGPSGGQGYHIYVLDASRGRRGPGPQRGQDWNKKEIKQPVTFPKGVDGRNFHNCIIECTWVEASQSWQFLRVREDKDKPNADYVCNKVIASIKDNIRESELVDYLESVFYHVPHYQEDLTTMPPEAKPASLPPPPTFQAPPQIGTHGPVGPSAAYDGAGGDATAANGVVDPDVMHHEPLVVPVPSPPYYGPEPTPPHPSDQPVLPDMWIPHDATKYPQEYLYPETWQEDPYAQPAGDPAYPNQQPGQEEPEPYSGQPEQQQQEQQQQQQWEGEEEGPPEGHEWNANSGQQKWQHQETSVDPYYVEEDEWNQWGKKQEPASSGGLTSLASNKASENRPAGQHEDGLGEQYAGAGRAEDGGMQGNGSAGSNNVGQAHAEKAAVRQTTGNQGAQDGSGKGVKRKESGAGERKPKRGKKMCEEEFFDDL